MKKRTEFVFWILSVFCTGLVMAATANASLEEPGQTPDDAYLARIKGTAVFEKRTTIVPMDGTLAICEVGMQCPKPEPYWSLVIVSDGIRYEFAEPFARGSAVPPDEIDVSGVQIRPGTRVAVEGMVYFISDKYSVISEVRDVSILSPLPQLRNAVAEVAMTDSVWSPYTEGWYCENRLGETAIAVEVWYGRIPGSTAGEGYRLQVEARPRPGAPLRPVALVDPLQMRLAPQQVVYRGANATGAAMLAIREVGASVTELPALLRLRTMLRTGRLVVPRDKEVSLSCTPSRLVRP